MRDRELTIEQKMALIALFGDQDIGTMKEGTPLKREHLTALLRPTRDDK